jgi:hypothetical protein
MVRILFPPALSPLNSGALSSFGHVLEADREVAVDKEALASGLDGSCRQAGAAETVDPRYIRRMK